MNCSWLFQRHVRFFSAVASLCLILMLLALYVYLCGKDVNWDQTNYHFYVAHSLINDRLDKDFMAANILSYVNPVPHLIFYFLVNFGWSSFLVSFLISLIQLLNFFLVYLLVKLISVEDFENFFSRVLVVAISFFHPVVLAELGTSLTDLLVTIPFLLAIFLAFKNLKGKFSVHVVVSCFLLGASAALKLTNVIFIFAFSPFFLICLVDQKKCVKSIVYCLFAFCVGFLSFGFWHFLVWRKFGNPFFPFFNNVFKSEYYPVAHHVHERFVVDSWMELLWFPLNALKYEKFITTEVVSIDARYAFYWLIFLFIFIRFLFSILRWGKEKGLLALFNHRISKNMEHRSRTQSELTSRREGAACLGGGGSPIARQALRLNDLEVRRLVFAFCYLIGYFFWLFSSGNARYGLILTLLSGPFSIILLSFLRIRSDFKILTLTLFLGLSITFIFYSFDDLFWQRSRHTDVWYDVYIPNDAIKENGLYVSTGYYDKNSNSYLVSWFPESSSFISLSGYISHSPRTSVGKYIGEKISIHKGPILVMSEGGPNYKKFDEEAREVWLYGLNMNINGFGLHVGVEAPCNSVCLGSNAEACDDKPMLTICEAERILPIDNVSQKRNVDAAFDFLESRYSKLLYPHQYSYYRRTDYCRFYEAQEYYLCEREGFVTLMRYAPFWFAELGSVETLNEIEKDENRLN